MSNNVEIDVAYDAMTLRLDDLINGKEQFTDSTNAELFVHAYRDTIRYCAAWKKWLIWNGNSWRADERFEIQAMCLEFLRSLFSKAASAKDHQRALEFEKHIVRSEALRKRKALVETATYVRSAWLDPGEMDGDPFLFNVRNGTIDLTTGIIHEPLKKKYITKCAAVEYQKGARCEVWLSFLDRIMGGRKDLISFLQMAVGLSLTGDMNVQSMFILHGNGANGKSTFLNAIMDVMGEYATTAQTETFLKKNANAMNNDVARLRGARFVTTMEAEQGRSLSEPVIKQVTGQDPLIARFLYGEFFVFLPTFKLFMATNHKPIIKGNDLGIWRRIKLIPFTVTIPEKERDPVLAQKLKCEKSGILNWAIEGCLRWQREGFVEPDDVRFATDEYHDEMDMLGTFIDECCVVDSTDTVRVSTGDLYRCYLSWCERNQERPYTHRIFAIRLQETGMKKGRSSSSRYWEGVGLR